MSRVFDQTVSYHSREKNIEHSAHKSSQHRHAESEDGTVFEHGLVVFQENTRGHQKIPPRMASAPSLKEFTMTYQIGYIVMKQIAHINMTIRTSKIISPVVRCLRQFFVAAANGLSPLLVRYRKLPQRAQNRELP